MVETNDRRLPVGIQSFEKIRKEGYLYVDKTDIIWQLANRNKTYNYLSRPRRFGKSVLVDTLEAYFMGKKELFEGLKIMQLETEWVKRPVIRLDMSRAGAEPGRLPVGIQSFEEIRKEGYLYVDKTDIIWQLANRGKKYNYLSRPRRFGKSVLVDTLEAYFMGKKELFEGLKIMQMETEWVKRPVIRLDMSRAGAEPETLRSYLDNIFRQYEEEYSLTPNPTDSLADRFDAIIVGAYKQTGQQVAILIDEYDSPLQHSWKTPQHEACTAIYREVFAILKADDKYEKFVFITGITKFTQISLFSVLNNLSNISFEPEYAAICGITKEEVLRDFKPEINKLAEYEDWTFDEAVAQLTAYYDGYHFSRRNMVDVFNPFSLINALADSDLKNYWASSGATSLLPKFVDDMELKLGNFDPCTILRQTIETSDVTGGGAELFLYQSGYLTIKDYQMGVYILGIS